MIMNDLVNKGDMNKEVFLVGNKIDRESKGERDLDHSVVENFAKNRRIKTKELSSKNYGQC